MSVYQTTRRRIPEDQPLCKEISVLTLDHTGRQGEVNERPAFQAAIKNRFGHQWSIGVQSYSRASIEFSPHLTITVQW
jgi:hypothetical protein